MNGLRKHLSSLPRRCYLLIFPPFSFLTPSLLRWILRSYESHPSAIPSPKSAPSHSWHQSYSQLMTPALISSCTSGRSFNFWLKLSARLCLSNSRCFS